MLGNWKSPSFFVIHYQKNSCNPWGVSQLQLGHLNNFLVGGFKHFSCSPRKLWKMNPISTSIFFKWVETKPPTRKGLEHQPFALEWLVGNGNIITTNIGEINPTYKGNHQPGQPSLGKASKVPVLDPSGTWSWRRPVWQRPASSTPLIVVTRRCQRFGENPKKMGGKTWAN